MSRLKIAVVGAGVAGLGAAWLLARRHDVTLFEREPRLGGHANTVDVATPQGALPIDTGFIVYNTQCYPNLIALFDHLKVATAPSRMGFAVSLDGGAYEYSGSGARGLFGQPANLVSADHWRMVRDILRFFREARTLEEGSAHPTTSLGAWLDQRGYSQAFVDRHILPMAAAIWSVPKREMLGYPAATFARFFANHGLLQVRNRPQWRTVAGGSRAYVARVKNDFGGTIVAGDPVTRVLRTGTGVTISTAGGHRAEFDRCLIATHADEALALLGGAATADETRILASFRYQPNTAILHDDPSHMPKRRRLWASWNYMGQPASDHLSVSYWMNALQPLAARTDYFVTLNPGRVIDPSRVHGKFTYTHPIYDAAAIAAQRALWQLQGTRSIWFAGAYFAYGFHEDALQAGLAAAEDMGNVRRPWRIPDQSSRLQDVVGVDGNSRAEAAQ